MGEDSPAGALVVTPSGEKAARNRHHWIFSGAVARYPEAENGSTVPVVSQRGEHLGYAYFNRRCSLCARLLSFDSTPPLLAVRRSLESALAMRRRLLGDRTDAFRVCNGEADGVPGLILDLYAGVAVMQLGTLGLERLRSELVEIILELLAPAALYERSDAASRAEEGLPPAEGWRAGRSAGAVEIREDGMRFLVQPETSQKTGFFLDQREMRAMVRSMSARKRVLDCFCYTGAFAIAALCGGASSADLVDSSATAVEAARVNLELNGLLDGRARVFRQDCFQFLREGSLPYDLVILDPPAFAKRKQDVSGAVRGYREINRLAIQKVPPGAVVATFSCSYHVDPELFQTVVFRAARDSGRPVRIIQRHRLASDHPINLYHPETEYLKGLVLEVG